MDGHNEAHVNIKQRNKICIRNGTIELRNRLSGVTLIDVSDFFVKRTLFTCERSELTWLVKFSLLLDEVSTVSIPLIPTWVVVICAVKMPVEGSFWTFVKGQKLSVKAVVFSEFCLAAFLIFMSLLYLFKCWQIDKVITEIVRSSTSGTIIRNMSKIKAVSKRLKPLSDKISSLKEQLAKIVGFAYGWLLNNTIWKTNWANRLPLLNTIKIIKKFFKRSEK